MNYKISEKPYPQNSYNMDYIRAATAFNNPWTALGALIGNVLSKNYSDRGERKLMESMKDSIPTGDSAQTEAQITQKMLENRPSQEETGNQALFNAYEKGSNNPIQPNYEVGLERLKNQSTDPLEIAALQGAINKAQPQEAEIGKVTPNEINGFDKYFQENVPHMDAQGNLSNMDAAANLQEQRAVQQGIPKFSADEWEAKMWQEGKKQGRPDYQIQAVIDRMKPQALQAEKRYGDSQIERYTNQFFNSLPDANGEGGDPVARLDALNEIAKYDPKQASILASGNVSLPATIARNDAQSQRAYRAQQDNVNNQLRAMQIAARSNGGTSRNGGIGGSDVKEPSSIKTLKQNLAYQVSKGLITEEQANATLDKANRQLGMTAAEKEADDYADNLIGKLDALMNNIGELPGTRDVEPSGQMLEEISQLIDENPKLWDKLDSEDKLVINSRRYYANAMREIAAGNEEMARQYAKAIPAYIAEREGWDLSNENIANLVKNFNGINALEEKEKTEKAMPKFTEALKDTLRTRGFSY